MGKPHVLVIPYPAQGHVIPLMELSQYLANHGCRITFVNTNYNHRLITDRFSATDDIANRVRLVSIPDGIESAQDRNKPGKMSEAILRIMPMNFEELVETIQGSDGDEISCVLADQSIGWALEIAAKKGIKRAAFCPAAAALLVLSLSIQKLIDDKIIDHDGTPKRNQVIKLSPTMPEMNTTNFVWAGIGSKEAQKNIFQLMINNNKALQLTDWLLCNSTYNLEPSAFTLTLKILPIGPLLSNTPIGNFHEQDSSCLKWLDQQLPNSVIYIAFGNSTVFEAAQLHELALGLELYNKPFLWVTRRDNNNHVIGKLSDPKCGKMIGWAPQKQVLEHPSTACFVSHCGWNSTMEGVSNGIPFLCWPYFADQFLNQTYIVDTWKVGLRLDKDELGVVRREEITRKMGMLLDNDEYKSRAMNLKELVVNNIKENGDSAKNLESFIEWINA